MTETSLTDSQNDYFIITAPVSAPQESAVEVIEEPHSQTAVATYHALLEQLSADGRITFAPKKPFDESKHKRGPGGKFAPKSGGGGKIDYKKKTAKKAPAPPADSESEAAPPKINYKKTAKKAAPPPPAKKTAPAPPPVKKAAPAAPPPPPPAPTPTTPPVGKKTVGKKTAKKIASPPPEDDDILDIPAPAAPATPEPSVPLVEVNEDLLENISVADGVYAEEGNRVIVDGRAGTVRVTDVDPSTGLNRSMGVQFDDAPDIVETVDDPWSAQVVEEAEPGFEDILEPPFGVDALTEPLPEPAPSSSSSDDDEDDEDVSAMPFEPTPGFEPMSGSDARQMQSEMLAGDPWSASQRQSLVTYSGDGYTQMNGCLRFDEGCDEDTEYDNEQASAAMRPTTRATTVVRGANLRALGVNNVSQLADRVGMRVRDHGFTSTSIASRTAFPGNVVMQIEVPEGTPAAYIDDISRHSGEQELLLDRGTRFEILEVREPEGDGPAQVRVRVVP